MSRHAAPRGRRGRERPAPPPTEVDRTAAPPPPTGAPPSRPSPSPLDPEVGGGAPRAHLAVALVAVVVTVGLAVATRYGRPGVVVGIGAVQALLVPAWVLGTGLPGRLGGSVIGLGAAAAADAALLIRDRTTLAVLLGVLALTFPSMLLHQLSRGVVRVRVTESMSGVALVVTAVVALSSCVALARAVDGPRLVAAVVVSAGAGLVVARLVDAVAPAPRLAHDVPYGLLAVLAGTAAGAATGPVLASGARQLTASGGALLGAVVAALAALLAVGVGYLAGTVEPRPAGAGRPALSYLGVGVPLALAAPVGYLVALSVAG